MLESTALTEVLQTIKPIPYSRNVYRCVELAALIGDGTRKIQPLYDLGPRQSGQRYTPIGGARALYVSENHTTSYLEATGMFSSVAALSEQIVPSEVTLQFKVSLGAVLDITLEENLKALATTTIELSRSWQWQMAMDLPVPTQILGESTFNSGRFQAIRFRSTRHSEVNLVIFTETVKDPSFVEVTDPKYYQRIP